MRSVKMMLPLAAGAGVLFMGLQHPKEALAQSCGRCTCYFPNSDTYGVLSTDGMTCTVCNCFVS